MSDEYYTWTCGWCECQYQISRVCADVVDYEYARLCRSCRDRKDRDEGPPKSSESPASDQAGVFK